MLCFLVACSGLYAKGKLRRICVDDNANITLQWYGYNGSCPLITGIEIYGRESAANPFVKVGDVDPSALEYTHTGAVAFVNGMYY
ncbi:MAG: hypothetical protein M3Q97_11790, partial [Bacteroidota bacterium]|nr:hypothetical protein [Bacteroidota bacterium]